MFYLFIILAATILIPLGVGIYRYSMINGAYRYFFMLIALGALNEVTMLSLTMSGISNLFMLHFYSTARLLLICLFYVALMPSYRKNILFIGIVTAVLSLAYAMIGNNLYDFNSIPRAIQSVLILAMGVYYSYYMATEGDSYDPLNKGVFFINGGLMFYFLGSFLIFTFSKANADPAILLPLYLAHSVISAICNLLYAYGLWISQRSYTQA